MTDVLNLRYKADGQKVYDPRTDTFVVSTNPALIMGDLIHSGNIISDIDSTIKEDSVFWKQIAMMADYCEEMVDE